MTQGSSGRDVTARPEVLRRPPEGRARPSRRSSFPTWRASACRQSRKAHLGHRERARPVRQAHAPSTPAAPFLLTGGGRRPLATQAMVGRWPQRHPPRPRCTSRTGVAAFRRPSEWAAGAAPLQLNDKIREERATTRVRLGRTRRPIFAGAVVSKPRSAIGTGPTSSSRMVRNRKSDGNTPVPPRVDLEGVRDGRARLFVSGREGQPLMSAWDHRRVCGEAILPGLGLASSRSDLAVTSSRSVQDDRLRSSA